MDLGLAGKRALVTGATMGIGLAVADAFLREGASVVISSRSEENGDKALRALDAPGRAHFVRCDVTEMQQVFDLVDAAAELLGGLDILVNNAGGSKDLGAMVADFDPELWDYHMRWNLYSVFWGTKAALKHMVPKQYGRIINMSSVEGKHPSAIATPYGTAKHGVNGFTKAAAKEYGTQGITINALCPGTIITDVWLRTGPGTAAGLGMTFDEFITAYTATS